MDGSELSNGDFPPSSGLVLAHSEGSCWHGGSWDLGLALEEECG